MRIKSRYPKNGYTCMIPESKKPNLKGWAFCWVFLVPTAGFELAT